MGDTNDYWCGFELLITPPLEVLYCTAEKRSHIKGITIAITPAAVHTIHCRPSATVCEINVIDGYEAAWLLEQFKKQNFMLRTVLFGTIAPRTLLTWQCNGRKFVVPLLSMESQYSLTDP